MDSGRSHFKLKVLLIVAVILTVVSITYITVQIRVYDRDLQWAINREEESLVSIITLLEQYYLNINSQRFFSIARNKTVSAAFAQRDRNKLYTIVQPDYLAMKVHHKCGINMHFHLPDGTSFLRMHLPDKHGDDLKKARPVIQEVHDKHKGFSAYEIGRSGCFFRVVEPLFYEQKYIGAVEIGMPVCTFAETIHDLLRTDTHLFFVRDKWSKVENNRLQVKPAGEFILMYHGKAKSDLPLPQKDLINDLHRTVEYRDKINIVHSLPIFKNHDGKIIGGIITYQDITPFIHRKREFIKTALVQMGVLFVVSMIVLYFTVGRLMDKVQAHQHKQAELLESLEKEMFKRKRSQKESNSLQAQLLQAQKMEALGLLSSGVAHDFNNMLTTIMGYTQLILRTAKLDETVQKQMVSISSAGEKAAGLVRQLLAFSRKQIIEMKPINLAIVVRNMSTMLMRLLGENVEFVLDLEEDQTLIYGDRTQIEQVLMNLSVNARDAMPQGGAITITVKPFVAEKEIHCAFSDVSPGKYVMLTFKDTGNGIDTADMERIFEPFFTTKPEGRGTGLGLSTVFGIVSQHNGHVCVESELDKWTMFKIAFPALQKSKDEEVISEEPELLLHGTETILVVEDELSTQEVINDMLLSLGYTVHIARNAAEAESILAKESEDISVVLIDLVLPDMNGHELYLRLKEHKKGLKVIYMSGYSEEMLLNYGLDAKQIRFLHKPLGTQQVAKTIRECIDQN